MPADGRGPGRGVEGPPTTSRTPRGAPRRFELALPCAVAAAVVLLAACRAAPPAPAVEEHPRVLPASPSPPAAPQVWVRVTGSRLNVRAAPDGNAGIVARVKRGDRLQVAEDRGDWLRITLPDGRDGWVAARYVRRVEPCQSDKATAEVLETPPLSFSEVGGHGTVRLEAEVDASGRVVSTRVVENTAGEAAAALADNELRQMKFAPPVRRCRPIPFVYLYTRTF